MRDVPERSQRLDAAFYPTCGKANEICGNASCLPTFELLREGDGLRIADV
jgi:hypothetical protein